MKGIRFFIYGLIWMFPLLASAGDKIGNGGGLWACTDSRDNIYQTELVDLFEARVEFFLKPIVFEPTDNYQQIYQSIVDHLKKNAPHFFKELEPYLSYVENNISYVDANLVPIDDGLFRIRPLPFECRDGEWKYLQFANFTEYGSILIQKDLWQNARVSAFSKAALLVHEGIYYLLRDQYKDTNSVRARRLTGIVTSDISSENLENSIFRVLSRKPGDKPEDAVDDSKGFYLDFSRDNPSLEGVLHRADAKYGEDVGTGNFSRQCQILPGATQVDSDILCILELAEGDVFYQDLTIRIHAPSSCEYLRSKPYYLYSFEPGKGPLISSYEILADGSIRDIENSRNGVPQCIYDYSQNEEIYQGPNCCVGQYNHKVRVHNADGTYSETNTVQSWDGSVTNCIIGPAIHSQTRDSNGIPFDSLLYTKSSGINFFYKIGSAISGVLQNSNVEVANFYQPSKHDGVPKAMRRQATLPRIIAPATNDTYEWACIDRFGDIKQRLRLMIRPWASGAIREGGDPDAGERNYSTWNEFVNYYPGLELLLKKLKLLISDLLR